MAYNGGFPVTYPQYYPQYQAPAQQNAQNQQNGIIWVQGEAGAKSYLVAPNNTVQLWDSEAQVIYLKSADASGMPSMKILDYTVRDPAKIAQAPVPDAKAFATKEEISGIEEQIKTLRDRVDSLMKEVKG